MQKFVEFLEKYIEWIAIGLGGLFFLLMVYMYVIGSPVSDQIGQHTVTIHNVDEYVRDNPGEKLVSAMDDQTVTVPPFPVQNFSDAVNKSLSMEGSSELVMAAAVPYQPIELPTGSNPLSTSPTIDSVPMLPAAVQIGIEHGHSTILVQAVNPAVAPASGPPMGLAGVGPGPGAPAGPAGAGVKRDIDWATVIFEIPVSPLADQWTKCFGPPKEGDSWKLQTPINTQVLMATLYRQEKDANGNWTKPQAVARLFNNPLPDYPAPDNRGAEDAYRKWAENFQPSIITPPFPQLAGAASGTVWETPLQVIQEIINPTAKPAVGGPIIGPTGPVGPPLRQPNNPTGTPRNSVSGGRPNMAGGGPGYPATPGRPATPSPKPVTPVVAQPLPPESTEAHVAAAPGVTLTVPPITVTTSFDVMALTNDARNGAVNANILVYLHDDTIRAGTTYRYCLDYKLANPLFNKLPERAKDAKWVDQLDLVSPMSDVNASAVITPEGRLFFYCGQPNQPLQLGAPFPFEIITWADGFWQRQVFKVNPGDAIGGVSAAGVDFSTGYTYVDGRMVNGHYMVSLLDPAGNVVMRNADRDYGSSDRKLHNSQVDASKPPVESPR